MSRTVLAAIGPISVVNDVNDGGGHVEILERYDDGSGHEVIWVDHEHLPDLIAALRKVKTGPCGYCDDRGYYFNDKSWSPDYVGEEPGWDNYGFSLCTCPMADGVDMTETPTEPGR